MLDSHSVEVVIACILFSKLKILGEFLKKKKKIKKKKN